MNFDNRTVTYAGATLLAHSDSVKKATIVDSIIISSNTPSNSADYAKLTFGDFGNYKEFPVINIRQSDNTFQPEALVTNEGFTRDFPMSMVGLKAHTDGENNAALIAVTIDSSNTPFTIPSQTSVPYKLYVDLPIGYSNSKNVLMNVNNAGMVTSDDVDRMISLAIQGFETTDNHKKDIDSLAADISNVANSDDIKNMSTRIDTNSNGIANLNSNVANAYQNAVNTAKEYTDKAVPYTITSNESDAMSQANAAIKPGLFLYPTADDASKVSKYKHVLGIYSWGATLPISTLTLTNLDSSKFTFNNAYATYDPNVNRVYLHGSISANNVSGSTNVFSFNIKNLSMNDIESSWLNFQTFSIDSDTNRENIIGTTSSNSTLNLEGCTINLKYDGSLGPKYKYKYNSDGTYNLDSVFTTSFASGGNPSYINVNTNKNVLSLFSQITNIKVMFWQNSGNPSYINPTNVLYAKITPTGDQGTGLRLYQTYSLNQLASSFNIDISSGVWNNDKISWSCWALVAGYDSSGKLIGYTSVRP